MGGVNVEVSSLSVPISPPSAPVLPERTPEFCCCPYEDIVLGPMMR